MTRLLVVCLLSLPPLLASNPPMVSNRQYSYSSQLCLKTSHNLSSESWGRETEASCPGLLCEYQAGVVVSLALDEKREERQYTFSMEKVTTNCGGSEASQHFGALFGARIFGQGSVDKSFGATDRTVRGIQEGIINTFLTSAEVKEGTFREEENCDITEFKQEKGVGFEKICHLGSKPEDTAVVKTKIRSVKQFRLAYGEFGMDVRVEESVFCSSSIQPDLGILVKSDIKLNYISDVEQQKDTENTLVNNEELADAELSKEDLLEKTKNLLVRIQKSKPTSILGTRAFLDLVSLLKPVTEENINAVLQKFKSKKAFKNLVDAVAGTGNASLYKAVLELIRTGEKNQKIFERFLIAVSFTSPSSSMLSLLWEEALLLSQTKSPLVETVLYSLCHLEGKTNTPDTRRLLDLVRGESLDCTDEICQKRMVSCVSALGQDTFSGQLMKQARESSSPLARELALATLGRPGMVASIHVDQVNRELAEVVRGEGTMMERMAALNSLSVDTSTSPVLLEVTQSPDPDLRSLVGQKLEQAALSVVGDKDNVLNYHVLSLQHQAKSVYLDKGLGQVAGHRADYRFAVLMRGEALKRTNFALLARDSEGRAQELVRLDSFVGGLSSMVGEADPEDDENANASVQLSLFSLPLRPFPLFSSFSDLVDLYWSGAAQTLTSLLEGSVSLLHKDQEVSLANGLKLKLGAAAAFSFDLLGKAEISLWTQSGDTHLETWAVMAGDLEAQVGPLGVRSSVGGLAVLDLDTSLVMGTTVTTCVVMKTREAELQHVYTRSRGGEVEEEVSTKLIPGVTWNLNDKNNQMCNKLSK